MKNCDIIEVEGIDGVGKTTQCRMLKNWFGGRGKNTSIVKDLESTQLGRVIKSILITDEPRSRNVELFAFLCCKAQLVTEVIGHNLSQGINIICDRGVGSFMTYFEILGFERDFLSKVMAVALPEYYKPLTVLIDLDVDEAMLRNVAKPFHSKFDGMGKGFFEKQRALFLDLAGRDNWLVVDGRGSAEDVHQLVINAINKIDT